MKVTQDPDDVLNFSPSEGQLVGFHSTSISASVQIEKQGFLPDKIFDLSEHERLMAIAKTHNLDVFSYERWLSMRSVTFTVSPHDALKHITDGKSGGQGLKNITKIIEKLPKTLDEDDRRFVEKIESRINTIRECDPITYVVDLSNLGPRLDKDQHQPFYHYRWNPSVPLSNFSEIAPTRILLKLIHARAKA